MRKVTSQTQVLIVGAGPPGLMAACQLAIGNIPFRIIDKCDKPFKGSGALIIHARSLEIFHQMGIADMAISQGILAGKLHLIFNGKKRLSLSLKEIGKGQSRFSGLLLLEQSKTEKLLLDFLHARGISVERKAELTDFTHYDDGCTNIVKIANGRSIIIKSKYIIAADGSHSFIRNQLKIPFLGMTNELSLFVYDGKAEIDLPSDEICFSFTNKSSAGIFPLKGSRWRVDGTLSGEISLLENISFSDIEPDFASRNKLKIKLHEPEWFSIFHSHQQYAGSFNQKRCYIIGDAAHVFSPVGAQGMNTGMQDAYNLVWKLSMVLKGNSTESLLQSYHKERQPLAKKIIKSTEYLFRMVTGNSNFNKKIRLKVAPWLLEILFPVIEKQKAVSRYLFNEISEIGINYRNSPLSSDNFRGIFRFHRPRPGDRLPYFPFNHGENEMNIQDMVNSSFFHLFVFSRNSIPMEFMAHTHKYSGWLSAHFIPFDQGTRPLYQRLGIGKAGCYLVRPDMYIACRSKKLIIDNFENYLKKLSIVTLEKIQGND